MWTSKHLPKPMGRCSPWRFLVAAASLSIAVLPLQGQEGYVALPKILENRSRAVATFRADIQYQEQLSEDARRHAKVLMQTAEMIEKKQITLAKGNPEKLKKSAETIMASVGVPGSTSYYRYLADYLGGNIRIEAYQESRSPVPHPFVVEPIIRVYAKGQWEVFLPASRRHSESSKRNQSIQSFDANTNPPFGEIARGNAVPLHAILAGYAVSAQSKALLQVSLQELLQVLDAKSIQEVRKSLPNSDEQLPVLEISSHPFEKTGLRYFRVRIWCDPKSGYLPIRIETETLGDDRIPDSPKYFADHVIEWSQPLKLVGGEVVMTRCQLHEFGTMSVPVEGKSQTEWPLESYQRSTKTYILSNIALNEPMNSKLFNVNTPPGTRVIDEPKGYEFIVGSAGEELKKTALAIRGSVAPARTKSTDWTRMLAIIIGLSLIAILAYALYRTRRLSPRKG